MLRCPPVVAHYDSATGRYVVPPQGDHASMAFTHPFAAARSGIVVAGEVDVADRQVELQRRPSVVLRGVAL